VLPLTKAPRGEGNIIPVTLGGVLPSGSNLPPAVLVGLQGFMFFGHVSWFDSIIVRENNLSINAAYRSVPGTGWILEGSADFQSWQPTSTNTMDSPAGNMIFEVPHSPTESVRIFRLRLTTNF
jgi:hypothetical protein